MTGSVSIETPFGYVKRGVFTPGQTIADLYREQGLSPSIPVICLRNGVPLLRKRERWVRRDGRRLKVIHDYRRWEVMRAREGDEIAFLCTLQGDDAGKNILRTVALVGLAVGAAFVVGPAGFGLASSIGTLGAAAVQAGIVIGGSFLLSVLIPITPAQADSTTASGAVDASSVSPTYSIDAQGNRARLFQPIPRLYGRHRIFPDFVTQPYTVFDGHEQYLLQTFGLGLGSYSVEQVNIGDTSIWENGFPTNHYPSLELRLFDPGVAPDLFPFNVRVSDEVSGQELRAFGLGNFSLSGTALTIVPNHSTGYELTGFRAGDQIQIAGCGANDGLYFVANVDPGTLNATTGFPSAGAFPGGTVELPGVGVGPFVTTPPGRKATRLDFDITFPDGLGVYDNSGNLGTYQVQMYLYATEIDVDSGVPIGSEFLLQSPFTFFNDGNRQPRRFTVTFPISPAKRLRVRIVRISGNSVSEKVLDKSFWTGLRGFYDGPMTFPDITTMQVKLRAGAEISTAATRTFNVIETAKVPLWSGPDSRFWTAPQSTQSIAWPIADLLRNETYGLGRSDDSIDLDRLWDLSLTWDGRDDRFCGIYDTSQTAWDALKQICAAGRAQPVLVGNIISFVRDAPAGLARGVFTPRNIRDSSLEITHILVDDKTPNSINVEFIDERTWQSNEVTCVVAGGPADNPARISLFGVTRIAQAQREGNFLAACNVYRRILVSFSTELEGKLLVKGDTILVSHDVMQWGQNGEIAAPRNGNILTLSNFPTFTTGNHYVVLSDKSNRQWGPVLVTATPSQPDQVTLDSASLSAIEATEGPLNAILFNQQNDQTPTRYMFGVGTTYAKRCKVISIDPSDMNTIKILAVVDDDRVYVN